MINPFTLKHKNRTKDKLGGGPIYKIFLFFYQI